MNLDNKIDIDNSVEGAARHLLALQRSGQPGARLPPGCRPADSDSAFRIQQRVAALLGAAIGGWKCALPSPGKVVAAPIYAATIMHTSPCGVAAVDGLALVEPEIAFAMGDDLPPRATAYSLAEVRRAIGTTHLAFELIGSRYADAAAPDFLELLADRLLNAGLFVGPSIEYESELALAACTLTLSGPQGPIGRWDGRHPDGNPLLALHWLANFLNSKGCGLQRGQVVTTGSFNGLMRLPLDTALTMRFGQLGALDIEFGALRPR